MRTNYTRTIAIACACLASASVAFAAELPEWKGATPASVPAGPFKPTWESLETCKVPEWYKDAKFGIFIHWGVYSVPAFGSEWYPRQMYQQGSGEFKHHVETYGPQSKFGYKDFIPMFKAQKFDAKQWADLFKKAGAKYVVPVAEHHDGFAMYNSSLTKWCAGKMGPKRDIIGELAKAVRKDGMIFGLSSHRAEHWWFLNGGMAFDSDVQDANYYDFYGPAQPEQDPSNAYMDDWLARCQELVDKYHPQIFWFDWWIGRSSFKPYLQQFAAYYFNRGAEWKKGVAINYKNDAFPDKVGVLDLERGGLGGIRDSLWQTDTSVAKNSWGYTAHQDYKKSDQIVYNLIDIVSKNGVLLLNIGPKSDGTIPDPEQKMLLDIGKWLGVNGEAIYGTRAWNIYGEGPQKIGGGSFSDSAEYQFSAKDFRFTTKPNTVYAIVLAWPADGKLVVRSLPKSTAGTVTSVSLLGYKGKLQWTQDDSGLTVTLPAAKPCEYAYSLKITGRDLKGIVPVNTVPAPPKATSH